MNSVEKRLSDKQTEANLIELIRAECADQEQMIELLRGMLAMLREARAEHNVRTH